MKDFVVRERDTVSKMAKQVLTKIQEDIKEDLQDMLLQHDQAKETNRKQGYELEKLRFHNSDLLKELASVRSWAKWDEYQHQEFTMRLRDDGLQYEDLFDMDKET